MVEVKRGRGRPRKNPVGVFKLEDTKRPVGRPKKKKMGRPVGSKNKTKVRPAKSLTIERRVEIVEYGMSIIIDALNILGAAVMKKKTR